MTEKLQKDVELIAENIHTVMVRLDKLQGELSSLIHALASGGRQHIAVAVDSMVKDIENIRRDTAYLREQWAKMIKPGSTWPGDSH